MGVWWEHRPGGSPIEYNVDRERVKVVEAYAPYREGLLKIQTLINAHAFALQSLKVTVRTREHTLACASCSETVVSFDAAFEKHGLDTSPVQSGDRVLCAALATFGSSSMIAL